MSDHLGSGSRLQQERGNGDKNRLFSRPYKQCPRGAGPRGADPGGASYLYVNNPEAKFSSLLATIVVMFLVLVVSIWESFAFLQKGQTGDTVRIELPHDRRYITGMGLMYGLLLLGLFYFAMFFLFELPAKSVSNAQQSAPATHTLPKPNPKIDQTKDEVLKVWGQPLSEDVANRTLLYGFDDSVMRLTFDETQKLVEINNRRKKL